MTRQHHHGNDSASVRAGIVTVSDTRVEADDTSGQRIRAALAEAGHQISFYRIVKDEPTQIVELISSPPQPAEVIITNGGTGLAPRDTTFEAVSSLIEREMPGFGELFRMLSYEQIGAAAMLSRATAGIAGSSVLFCLPGATKAVDLAMTKLIIPQVRHIVGLVRHP